MNFSERITSFISFSDAYVRFKQLDYQVATLTPEWHRASIERRNSVRNITVGCDLRGMTSQVAAEKKVKAWMRDNLELPDGVQMSYGGLRAINGEMVAQILWSVVAMLLVMFVLLLYHFGKVSLALLTLSSAVLCVFGVPCPPFLMVL